MTHLKHASPIRRAAQMKRTAMVEIYSEEPALSVFHVEIIAGGRVVKAFEAMATDSCTVVAQHADLCERGEKMSVMRLDLWRELRRDAERALQQQMDAATRRDWRATP